MKGSNLRKTQWLLIALRICWGPAWFPWPFAQSWDLECCWLPCCSCVILKTGCQSTSSTETSAALFCTSQRKRRALRFSWRLAHTCQERWLGSLSPQRASDIRTGSRWLSLSLSDPLDLHVQLWLQRGPAVSRQSCGRRKLPGWGLVYQLGVSLTCRDWN